jgi:hypothetical protein
VFVCKSDESQSLEGVYFIPRLATNIVSNRKLDEVGYKIDIDTSVMKIWDPRGLLLVKVKHKANRLYLLHISSLGRCASQCTGGATRWRGIGMSASGTSTWRPFRS